MKKNMLNGKVAVISGGDSGIGLAISKRLFAEGVKIYNISRSGKENEIFVESLSCDISNDKLMQEVVNKIVSKTKIDFLFCNAGFGIGGLVENASVENIDKIMKVNLTAHIQMTKLFIPYINEGGKILYTGSLAAILPLPYQACYSASKAGLLSFARALRTELKPRKIGVNVFLPTDTKTGFTDARIKETGASDKEKQGIVKMEKEEKNGKDPDFIAKKVLKLVKKKKMPVCKTAGGFGPLSGGFLGFLVKILPNRFVDWLIEKIYL